MGTLNELLELLHALINIDCEVRIDIVIVGNGIRRACPTLHNGRMVLGNAIRRIVSLGGMTDDARVPNMAHAHLPDFLQGAGREVIHLSATVLGNRAILLTSGITITVKSCKDLI